MSEEFNEGMNENRGMAEEHKGPEENPSITETPGSVNFTMKEAAEEKTTEQEQTAPGYGNAEAASETPVYGNTDTASGAAEATPCALAYTIRCDKPPNETNLFKTESD